MTRLMTKAVMMARSGMLECSNNYKNKYKTSSCQKCGVEDSEIHRINDCILYRKTSKYDKQDKFDYKLVYSDKPEEIRKAAEAILNIWDLANGKNTMKSVQTE